MSNKHLMIIDPIEKLDLKKDTSLKTARALFLKNEDVYVCQASDLFWLLDTHTPCSVVQKIHNIDKKRVLTLGKKQDTLLGDFHCIHIRKEPPVNFDYMYMNLLLLEAEKKGLTIYNSPSSLLKYNEKLLPFFYPQQAIKSLCCANANRIQEFIEKNCRGDAVMKKLNLFGGKDVIRIKTKDMSQKQLEKILSKETCNSQSPVQVQAFMQEVYEGEIRVFTAKGEIIASCLKKPAKGSFLANTCSGASIQDFPLSSKLEEIISKIAVDLYKKGIFFTGFDIIANQISEINITSPRLLVAQEDDSDYFYKIADLIIKDLEEKNI